MSKTIRLHLIRHGDTAAPWAEEPDPGLSDLGHSQAAEMAEAMAPLGPLPLICSPMRRTQETAAPLLSEWNLEPRLEPRVTEIPGPAGSPAERRVWLERMLAARWPEVEPELQDWRRSVLAALRDIEQETVVVSHYVAINVAVAEARGDDRLICFSPSHCSHTVLEVGDGGFEIVALNDSAESDLPLPG
jgi:broad specificity phosphatase PhoE